LFAQPLGEITGGAATGNDFETFLVKALTDGGSDTAHATSDVRYFLTHWVVS
jgi:hypothetical protein